MADALSYGDELIDNMIEAAFLTMGQNCTAGSRVLVHRSIAEEVPSGSRQQRRTRHR